jgi:tetratricopeptide (TPR) repeat protein
VQRGDFAAAESATARTAGLLLQPAEAEESPNADAFLEIMAQELAGLAAFRRGDREGGLNVVERASARYEAVPFEFGPPVPVKPPQELAGEMLLEMGRPAEAVEYFDRSLRLAPRRSQSLLGLARAAAAKGDGKRARAAYQELMTNWHSADAGLADKDEATQWLATHTGGS